MSEANTMYEAASAMDAASRRYMYAVLAQIELEMMIAENKKRELNGEALSYTEDAFARLYHSLMDQNCRL